MSGVWTYGRTLGERCARSIGRRSAGREAWRNRGGGVAWRDMVRAFDSLRAEFSEVFEAEPGGLYGGDVVALVLFDDAPIDVVFFGGSQDGGEVDVAGADSGEASFGAREHVFEVEDQDAFAEFMDKGEEFRTAMPDPIGIDLGADEGGVGVIEEDIEAGFAVEFLEFEAMVVIGELEAAFSAGGAELVHDDGGDFPIGGGFSAFFGEVGDDDVVGTEDMGLVEGLWEVGFEEVDGGHASGDLEAGLIVDFSIGFGFVEVA